MPTASTAGARGHGHHGSTGSHAAARRQMQELRSQVTSLKQKVAKRGGGGLRGLIEAPPPSDQCLPSTPMTPITHPDGSVAGSGGGVRVSYASTPAQTPPPAADGGFEREAVDLCMDAVRRGPPSGSPVECMRDGDGADTSWVDLVGAEGVVKLEPSGEAARYRDVNSYSYLTETRRHEALRRDAVERSSIRRAVMTMSPAAHGSRGRLDDPPTPFWAFNATGKELDVTLDPSGRDEWVDDGGRREHKQQPPPADTPSRDVMTQVNAPADQGEICCTCGSGRYHTHKCVGGAGVVTTRAGQEHAPSFVTDYCVHATTTTKAEVPGYALPTWSSWPAGSRFAPCEIEGGGSKRQLQRRSVSRSPYRTSRAGVTRSQRRSASRSGPGMGLDSTSVGYVDYLAHESGVRSRSASPAVLNTGAVSMAPAGRDPRGQAHGPDEVEAAASASGDPAGHMPESGGEDADGQGHRGNDDDDDDDVHDVDGTAFTIHRPTHTSLNTSGGDPHPTAVAGSAYAPRVRVGGGSPYVDAYAYVHPYSAVDDADVVGGVRVPVRSGPRSAGRSPSPRPRGARGSVQPTSWDRLYDRGMYNKQVKLQREIDSIYEKRAAEEAVVRQFKYVPNYYRVVETAPAEDGGPGSQPRMRARGPSSDTFERLYRSGLKRPDPSPTADYFVRRPIDPFLRDDPTPEFARARPGWRAASAVTSRTADAPAGGGGGGDPPRRPVRRRADDSVFERLSPNKAWQTQTHTPQGGDYETPVRGTASTQKRPLTCSPFSLRTGERAAAQHEVRRKRQEAAAATAEQDARVSCRRSRSGSPGGRRRARSRSRSPAAARSTRASPARSTRSTGGSKAKQRGGKRAAAAPAPADASIAAALAVPEPQLIAALFDAIDTDGDGYWSFDEAQLWGEITKGGMSHAEWIALCEAHGAEPERGLSRESIEGSYAKGGTAVQHYEQVLRYVEAKLGAEATRGAPGGAATGAGGGLDEALLPEDAGKGVGEEERDCGAGALRENAEDTTAGDSHDDIHPKPGSGRGGCDPFADDENDDQSGTSPTARSPASPDDFDASPYVGIVASYDDDDDDDDDDANNNSNSNNPDATHSRKDGDNDAGSPYAGTNRDMSPESLTFVDVTTPTPGAHDDATSADDDSSPS